MGNSSECAFVDRLGRGIRTALRDALIADPLNFWERGKGFGIHRAMDTVGAATGLLIVGEIIFIYQGGALELSLGTYQKLVIVGIVPALLALLIFLFIKEAKRKLESKGPVYSNISYDNTKPVNKQIIKKY